MMAWIDEYEQGVSAGQREAQEQMADGEYTGEWTIEDVEENSTYEYDSGFGYNTVSEFDAPLPDYSDSDSRDMMMVAVVVTILFVGWLLWFR